jgi:hypothetical protein
MTVDNGANWDAIYMDEFENDDLIEVFKQIEIGIAKVLHVILFLSKMYISLLVVKILMAKNQAV